MKTFTVCRKCKIHHIDNCSTCFGFGCVKDCQGKLTAITAGEAKRKETRGWVACPECQSTPKGIQESTP